MLVVRPTTKYQGCCGRGVDGLGNANLVAREDAADIDLVGGKVGEAVVAIARHQVPLVAEVMVHAGGKEVAASAESKRWLCSR